MVNLDELLVSILQNLDKNSSTRELIDKALEAQDYKYNEEGFIQSIHTNPLFAAFDDPSILRLEMLLGINILVLPLKLLHILMVLMD